MQNNSIINVIEGVKFRKSIIDKTKIEINEKLAENFSVFSYIPFDEVSMSNLLRDLLDKDGKHGQGPLFLNLFIKMMERQLKTKIDGIPDYKLFEVHTEVRTSRIENNLRRIDILIQWGQKFAIGIENKPYAKCQPDQLKDYAEHLEYNYHNNFILVFLSDREPSINSIPLDKLDSLKLDKKFVHLNFKDDLISWLEESKQKSKAIKIQLFLTDLINKLKEREHMEQETNKEIIDYLSQSDDNLKATFEIANSVNNILNQIATNWIEELKIELNRKTSRKFQFDSTINNNKIELSIKNEKWGPNFCGIFDLDSDGLFYSVVGESDFFEFLKSKNLLTQFQPWQDNSGRNHLWRSHDLNHWFSDINSVLKFKSEISSTINELEILIAALDQYTEFNTK